MLADVSNITQQQVALSGGFIIVEIRNFIPVLPSVDWSDITIVYVPCFVSQFVIGQFGSSVYFPRTRRGCLPLKVNVKYTGLNRAKYCDMFRLLLCFESERKWSEIVTSFLKNLTWNICSLEIQ